ncbi:MAG: MiaB/RimO family radical SAM methylthiotransferase [Candidatus Shapirobacteria bacterium]|nr:MiaB/RimO family radical SAM methylthiotransferase [Candidatus Shapirobacteria bacterium]MDD5481833.1 MiaB/RimO family radical SAM methylthiotransferase [Candidatus Shapirobacteria bacterium]
MNSVTFLTQTLGCRANQAETKKIETDLISLGHQPAKEKQTPNTIILNTCVITQKGENESARAIRQLKKQYPDSFFIVTGCAVNLWLNISKKKPLPPADLFVTNEKKSTIPEIITNRLPFSCQIPDLSRPNRASLLLDPGSNKRTFVKIQDGCNHFCSYCIVPYLRKRPSSKSPKQIIKEINQACQTGTQEAILCGINLSLYGKDLVPTTSLAYLIKEILKKTNLPRLSLSSLTPELIDQEFVDIFIADQKKDQRLSSYWHLALQSGSESVLKRMNRRTNLKKLAQSLQYTKEALPYFTLRADIIVGFPDETEEEFNQTLEFINNNDIAFGHLFPYSPRPQTQAQKKIVGGIWKTISDKVKKNRKRRLSFALQKNRQTGGKKIMNSQRLVLVLKKTPYGWWGLSDNYWPTKIKTSKDENKKYLGKIIPVKISALEDKTLRGNLVDAD